MKKKGIAQELHTIIPHMSMGKKIVRSWSFYMLSNQDIHANMFVDKNNIKETYTEGTRAIKGEGRGGGIKWCMHLYSAIKIKTSVIKTVVYVHTDHKGHQQRTS